MSGSDLSDYTPSTSRFSGRQEWGASMQRRAEFRPFSWLNDLHGRNQLDLEPPYQRRSVWSDKYRSDFITTVLMNYPCPAIFLFEQIRPDGTFFYKVVDGKQRVTTLLNFVRDGFPVSDDFPNETLRGKLFSQFDDGLKLTVWRYSFTVEFIEQENEAIINDIFNRINKNVARLTPQELRHAKFYGKFSQAAERLTEFTESKLPTGFPRIASQSKRQMKDVENVANLLLFCELGERSISQLDLDNAYSQREDEWESETEITDIFSRSVDYLHNVTMPPDGEFITDLD